MKQFYLILTIIIPVIVLILIWSQKHSANDTVAQTYIKGNIMEILSNKESLEPTLVPLKQEVKKIFSVPLSSSIGTIDLHNAISAIHFSGKKTSVDIIKKNFVKEVSGSYVYTFTPEYSNTEIAYTQSKRVVFQTVDTKKNRNIFVIKNFDDYLGKLAPLNLNKNIFAVQIDKPYYGKGSRKEIAVGAMDGENGDTFKPQWTVPGGIKTRNHDGPWFTYKNLLFVYDIETKKLNTFDETGTKSTHPLEKVIERNSEKLQRVTEIITHPKHPFAILVEKGVLPVDELDKLKKARTNGAITDLQYDKLSDPLFAQRDRHSLWLLRWDTSDLDSQMIPLLTPAVSVIGNLEGYTSYSHIEFSADGDVMIFRDNTHSRKKPRFVAIPICDSLPLFLGDAVHLKTNVRFETERSVKAEGTAWINTPTSFVMTDGKIMYKWDFFEK